MLHTTAAALWVEGAVRGSVSMANAKKKRGDAKHHLPSDTEDGGTLDGRSRREGHKHGDEESPDHVPLPGLSHHQEPSGKYEGEQRG